MTLMIWIALFLPLAGFVILLFSAYRIGRTATGIIACTTVFLSFCLFSCLLLLYESLRMSPQNYTLFTWLPIEKIHADFTLHLDPLALLMSLIITGVGFLIHLYANGYMDHEQDYARFFACMNFFVFSMLLLVLGGHLLVLFLGWEGVGLASYLLIGYWYFKPEAASAATKAFVMNRIGDFGLLLALIITFYTFGTGNIEEIGERAHQDYPLGAPILVLLSGLFFLGAIGKSAQIPLHTWLPDAMEGPTPVSALIHAATMVTAGVYLVVRLHSLFMHVPTVLHFVGTVGGITSLFAATCALGQTDLKRVLAYSTVSQLGLMFLACGVGAFYAAMFHLTTHAFMKALLFLSAGNVVHMTHGLTDMNYMGGLKRNFYITHWLFLIGVLAMSGIPPLAAFFSKDLILEQEHLAGFETLFYIGLIASIFTAFYLTRAYALTFLGHNQSNKEEIQNAHEAPKIMIIPVLILALLSILGGFLGFAFGKPALLERFLAEIDISLPEKESGHFLLSKETWMSIIGGFLGFAVGWLAYTKYRNKVGNTLLFLKKAFYIDELYDTLFVSPLEKLSRWISDFLEPHVFEESLRFAGQGTQFIAKELQMLQSGQIRSYVAWVVMGAVFLLIFFVF